jgi:hypothetical protein
MAAPERANFPTTGVGASGSRWGLALSGLDNLDEFSGGRRLADEGQVPIEDIKVGDKVLAEDPETGQQGYFEVVALTSHAETEVLRITLDSEDKSDNNQDGQLNNTGEIMEVTAEHPVYIEGRGWIWAENLSIGDTLRRAGVRLRCWRLSGWCLMGRRWCITLR